jgi:hypothetical protein
VRPLGAVDSPVADIAQASFNRWKPHQEDSRAAEPRAGRAMATEAGAGSRKKAG